ncbi:MAG: CbiX/SirB N-terminal domain-containing protein [Nitrospirae bacterium]|nr:CbiX/SirB N-terminal domain-containing protein [Nitrospirota bacterium]
MSETELIIIAAHGSPLKESGGIAGVASTLHAMIHPKCNKDCVRVGYLQFGKPSIEDAIRKAIKDGAAKIIIHPYFLSSGIHVTKSIPAIINEAKASYPDVKFIYTEPLGSDDALAEIVFKKIRAAKEDE